MKLPSFALTLLLLVSGNLHAQQMSYQGRLTEANGAAAKPGPNATITFSLWDHATSLASANKVWGDFQRNVDLIDGRFSVKLGDAAGDDGNGNFLKDEFGGPRYLELKVGNDSPLPRQEVLYSPKAFHATNADLATNATDAVKAETADHATFATAIGNPSGGTAPLKVDFTNARVGVGTLFPETKLHVSSGDANQPAHPAAVVLIESDASAYVQINTQNGSEAGVLFGRDISSSSAGILYDADKKMNFRVGEGTRMTIAEAGNVGIGTTVPDAKLHVHGGRMRISGVSSPGVLELSNGTDINYVYTDHVGQLILSTDTAKDIVLQEINNGGVRIGSGVGPGQAKLVVGGVGTSNASTAGWDYNHGGNNAYSASSFAASIHATHPIQAQAFRAYSDARIKTIEGRSDSAADLATLNGLEITDYRYKDVISKGSRPQKKVIAQQIETVFPQAVSQITDTIPDIYQKAITEDGWVTLTTDLKKGERVRLIGETEEGIHEVLEVKEGAFRTAFKPTSEKVFVFGREVNDFRSVDYEAIAMLNVSATQELHRQLAAKSNEISALQQRLGALEAKDKARDEKFAKLERLLESHSEIIPISID